ncbi:dihydrolipoamide acetyltransferase family protein [Paenibacillus sp. tmac-D7]|uniref:dihydrolipoamide acetyltransferase family protein n=1 Tax=Paenibacillus sp. tmac-D7 TaxID=2591462 RepID=UPI0011411763|nr:dihydrolipoamide acetyltransferase family protein [Paenibacillus sp. tmac-D7]
MNVVRLPKMGLTMEEGIVQRFLVKPGQLYSKGDVVAEIETDKAVLEVEMPQDGVIEELLVLEGDTVEVGAPLLRLKSEQKTPEASVREAASPTERPQPNTECAKDAVAAASPDAELPLNQDRRIIAISPSARRRARELGIDYTTLQGTGPNGRILYADVEEAAQQIPLAPKESREASRNNAGATSARNTGVHQGKSKVVELSRMRRIIARRMVESVTTIPQFYVKRKVDLTQLLAVKNTIQPHIYRSRNIKISVNDFLIRAVAETLREFPQLNASFVGAPDQADSHIVEYEEIHIGLAVAAPNGLVVPVIHHADELSVMEIAGVRERLVSAARAGTLKGDDMQRGTFTISNLGAMDVEEFSAIVNPPEAGILAVGTTVEEIVVINGQFEIRPMLTLVGSFDHRVIDGLAAAAFMKKLVEKLQSDDWQLL